MLSFEFFEQGELVIAQERREKQKEETGSDSDKGLANPDLIR